MIISTIYWYLATIAKLFQYGEILEVYTSWAWGIVLTSKNIANFIGVATVSKKLAVAQYSNGAWTKIM